MALQFLVQLKDVYEPAVWRRVVVPDGYTFHQLHRVLQNAFGWHEENPYSFRPRAFQGEIKSPLPGYHYELGGSDDPQAVAHLVPLSDVFTRVGRECAYIYDPTDKWHHRIKLEEIAPARIRKARCIAGEGACPAEGCGGASGFARLKDIIANPFHDRHREMRMRLRLKPDEKWTARDFDLRAANDRISDARIEIG